MAVEQTQDKDGNLAVRMVSDQPDGCRPLAITLITAMSRFLPKQTARL